MGDPILGHDSENKKLLPVNVTSEGELKVFVMNHPEPPKYEQSYKEPKVDLPKVDLSSITIPDHGITFGSKINGSHSGIISFGVNPSNETSAFNINDSGELLTKNPSEYRINKNKNDYGMIILGENCSKKNFETLKLDNTGILKVSNVLPCVKSNYEFFNRGYNEPNTTIYSDNIFVRNKSKISFIGKTNNHNDPINVEFSIDNILWGTDNSLRIPAYDLSITEGSFAINIDVGAFSIVRLYQKNTTSETSYVEFYTVTR
jgi:hypothetical protein